MNRSDLTDAVGLARLPQPRSRVDVVGIDPVIPSPFRIGSGVSTALGMVGSAAADLWERRTGRRQEITVDLRHAVASLSSMRWVRLDDEPALGKFEHPNGGAALTTGLYQCADDRWVHMQSEFPHLHRAVLELLGADNTRESIAAQVKKWQSSELEEALTAGKLCGAVARTAGEWAAHPQGRALSGLATVEIEKIGDAPAERLPDSDRPLVGVRVLDLTRVLAGPTCARTLAEHGADVLHIASPKLPTFEALEIDTGHGKRQAWADLATVGGREVLRDLVQDSDVFSQGYRAGSLDRRGFGPRDVAKLRPGIVYVSINCFGHTGPWRERPGWEQLAQTVSGIVVGQGTDGMPETVPAAMNDYTTGYWGAYGAMTALARRAEEGGSWHVTVSLCQTSMWYERLGRSHSKDEAAVLEDVTAFSTTSETEWGRVTHLRPVVEMSETPTGWDQPTTPLGHDAPRWLSR